MLFKKLLVLLTTLPILAMAAPLPATASAFGITYGVDSKACVNFNGTCDAHQASAINVANPIYITPLNSSESSSNLGGQAAFATVYGDLRYGQIRGYVEADASASLGGAFGVADFDGVWADTITITSNSLALGAPVTVLITLDVSAILENTTAASSFLDLTLSLGGNQIRINQNGPANLHESEQLAVDTWVGAQLGFQEQLILGAVAQTSTNINSPSALVDVAHTTNAFLKVQTPGASYTTASGSSYSATPEPSSLLLFGSGILGLWCITKRRLRR